MFGLPISGKTVVVVVHRNLCCYFETEKGYWFGGLFDAIVPGFPGAADERVPVWGR